jgi:hypothetical protein
METCPFPWAGYQFDDQPLMGDDLNEEFLTLERDKKVNQPVKLVIAQ